MSTESKAISSDVRYTMDVNLMTVLLAVVLGSSLMEFNELLFPPNLTSLSFWALFSVYYSAFASWFSKRISMRYRPYTDSLNSRTRVIFEALGVITHAGLLYFASRVTDSIACYMWGWPVLLSTYMGVMFFRQRDLHLPEPWKPTTVSISVAITASTVYSVWSSVFPPIPDIAIWGFVLAMGVNIISFRAFLRWRHVWRPEYDEKRLKMGRAA